MGRDLRKVELRGRYIRAGYAFLGRKEPWCGRDVTEDGISACQLPRYDINLTALLDNLLYLPTILGQF